MPDASLVTIGTVIGLAGLAGWYMESQAHRAHRAWCDRAAKAEGEVSRIARRWHLSRNEPTDSDRVHAVPIVRFRAADGVEYEIDAPDAPHEIGAPVEVAYDPAQPSSGRPVSRVRKIGCIVVLLIVGIGLIVVGMARPSAA